MKPRILIVDDEDFVRESLLDLLESEGYTAEGASSAPQALEALEKGKLNAIVTDLRMPGMDGLALLAEAKKHLADVPVILLTGMGTVAEAVHAMKSGAYDFIQKPVDPEQFLILIQRAIEHRSLVSEVKYLRSAVEDLRGDSEMVGKSPAILAVRVLVAKVAPTDATVLITGESGTGKELVAAEVHRLSARAQNIFVRVNCAAIPETLFESEFFGHRRGSFTSAISDRSGRFAEADGGTLSLDEIGILKPDMQAKLLRVLETGEYQVVGESRMRLANVRVIASTNEDLAARVRDGSFRKDLYYRLNVFPIDVPPLRHRNEDVAPLVKHFVLRARGTRTPDRENASWIEEDAIEILRTYDWPGNVRELRNVMERACILCPQGSIDGAIVRKIVSSPALLESAAGADLHIRRRVDMLEQELISEALARTGNKKREAAELLGIDPKNFGYYLRKHQVASNDDVDS